MTAVTYEKNGRTAIITLNRPEAYNALNSEMYKGLADAFQLFEDDPEVWTAIFTGAGDKAFSAGGDLKEMAHLKAESEKAGRPFVSAVPEIVPPVKGVKIAKPIICAINGLAIGGGLELALACDIRVAAEHARLGVPEVTQGLIPGIGGTQRLPRLIPFGIALELLLTGKLITAQEAARWGLVNEVVPLSSLMNTCQAIADRINSNGPLAVRAAKEAAYCGIQLPLSEALSLESQMLVRLRQSEDAHEGPRAFAQKRKPFFRGV